MPWYYGIIQASIAGTILALIAFVCTKYIYKYLSKNILVLMWVISAVRYLCIFAIPLENAWILKLVEVEIPIEGYLIFMFILLIYYYNQYRQQIYHIRKLKNCTDIQTVELFEEIRQEYDTDNVVLRTEYSNDAPYTIGFINPKIIISLQRLAPVDLPFVLRHELCHIKNYDSLKNLLFIAVKIIHFFNPFVHILLPYARLAIEMSCDEMVISNQKVDTREYGNSLLNQASLIHHNIPMTTNYVPRTSSLKIRINALMSSITDIFKVVSKILLITFLVVSTLSLYTQTYIVRGKEEQTVPVQEETVYSDISFSLIMSDKLSLYQEYYIKAMITTFKQDELIIEKINVHYYNEDEEKIAVSSSSLDANDNICSNSKNVMSEVTVERVGSDVSKLKFEVVYLDTSTNSEKTYMTEFYNYYYVIDAYTAKSEYNFNTEYFRVIFQDMYEIISNKITLHVHFYALNEKESRIQRIRINHFNQDELIYTHIEELATVEPWLSVPNLSSYGGWGVGVRVLHVPETTHIMIEVDYVDAFTGIEYTASNNVKHSYDNFVKSFKEN